MVTVQIAQGATLPVTQAQGPAWQQNMTALQPVG
jgi:hypothetical protein